jgi:hypothetical protein
MHAMMLLEVSMMMRMTVVVVDAANVGLAHAAAQNSSRDGGDPSSPAPLYFTVGLFLGIVLTAIVLHYCYWRPKDRSRRNEWSLDGTSNDNKTVAMGDDDGDADGDADDDDDSGGGSGAVVVGGVRRSSPIVEADVEMNNSNNNDSNSDNDHRSNRIGIDTNVETNHDDDDEEVMDESRPCNEIVTSTTMSTNVSSRSGSTDSDSDSGGDVDDGYGGDGSSAILDSMTLCVDCSIAETTIKETTIAPTDHS